MTTQLPALEATLVRPRESTPSLERPRLYVEGEILPALYHWSVRVQLPNYYIETIAPGQHEIEAALDGLKHNEALRQSAIGVSSVTVCGVDSLGRLSEFPVTIRVSGDGTVAIPP